MSEMKIVADNRKTGMNMEEILDNLSRARQSGFTVMGRTEVGFGGQIQSMTFRTPEVKKEES